MKANLILFFCITLVFNSSAQKGKGKGEYYKILVYHFANDTQQNNLDSYLKSNFVPAMHIKGVKQIGVFKPIANDTVADKKIYVFFPVSSKEKLFDFPEKLNEDPGYLEAAKACVDPEYNHPCFARMEMILLKSFRLAPKMNLPALKNERKDHVYELRSYEGPTEGRYVNKVKMFNEGGEIDLFKRLNFNAVFYADVIAGSRMPNLMYMTSFENLDDRNAHWKTFSADPEWKKLSAKPEYQHNVSKIDVILMRATDYSDF